MIEDGLLTDTGERKGATKRVRVLRLNVDSEYPQKRVDSVQGNEPKNGNVPKNGSLNVPKNGSQNQSLEPVIESKNKTPVAAATNAEFIPRSQYAFEGNIVKLNHADFASWQKLYANVDLVYELQKLDIEFSHEKPKNWFITASQKLSYQNKQGVWRCQPPTGGVNQPHWNDLSEWENNFL